MEQIWRRCETRLQAVQTNRVLGEGARPRECEMNDNFVSRVVRFGPDLRKLRFAMVRGRVDAHTRVEAGSNLRRDG